MNVPQSPRYSFRWITDDLLLALFRNAGILTTGALGASALGMVAFALTARSLGLERFGQFALITAYAVLMTKLFAFQSWQALIKYGAEALERGASDEFCGLIRLGLALDASAALVSTGLAIAGALIAGQWEGWSDAVIGMIVVHSLTIATTVTGTPTAVLRLFGRFRLAAMQVIVSAGFRATAATMAFVSGAGLWTFVIVWTAGIVADNLLLIALSLRELRRQGYSLASALPMHAVLNRNPNLLRFFVSSNVTGMVRVARDLDIMIVGALLSLEAAGLYRAARQFATMLGKVVESFYNAIYPDLSRLWAAEDRRRFAQLIRSSSIILGLLGCGFWVAFLIIGKPSIMLLLGHQYLPAYGATLLFLLGLVMMAFAQPFGPAMFCTNQHRTLLMINIVTTAWYVGSTALLCKKFGLTGAASAVPVFYTVWAFAMLVALRNVIFGVSTKVVATEG